MPVASERDNRQQLPVIHRSAADSERGPRFNSRRPCRGKLGSRAADSQISGPSTSGLQRGKVWGGGTEEGLLYAPPSCGGVVVEAVHGRRQQRLTYIGAVSCAKRAFTFAVVRACVRACSHIKRGAVCSSGSYLPLRGGSLRKPLCVPRFTPRGKRRVPLLQKLRPRGPPRAYARRRSTAQMGQGSRARMLTRCACRSNRRRRSKHGPAVCGTPRSSVQKGPVRPP